MSLAEIVEDEDVTAGYSLQYSLTIGHRHTALSSLSHYVVL